MEFKSINDKVSLYPQYFKVDGYGTFSKKEHWDGATKKMKNIRNKVDEYSKLMGVRPEITALILHGENSLADYKGENIKSNLQTIEGFRDRLLIFLY